MEKKKILVVDDSESMIKLVKYNLETEGYDVITASDGLEGLMVARREKPNLIILDVALPEMDGFRVCRLLKFDQKYQHIPIIMLTASIKEDSMKLGMESGASFYITKPYKPDILLARVKKLIGESGGSENQIK